jgi:hypothetical protein
MAETFMPHLTPSEIIELDCLPGDAREAALAHLSICQVCRDARDAHLALWQQLGHWQAPKAPDLSSQVLWRMNSARWSRMDVLRVAAAVVIAAGIGYASGQITRTQRASEQIDSEQAMAALHLDELDDGDGGPLAVLLEPLEGSAP